MSFTTLQSLLTLTEADDAAMANLGPKEHPTLSRAEMVRFADKIGQAQAKLDEIESIFKHAPGATGPAHKLHHIGVKAGADMSALSDVQNKIHDLGNAIDELHMMWGSSMQQDTGAFDDQDPDASTDEAPAEDEADTEADPMAEPIDDDEDAVKAKP
jgi:hypothetical protein